MARVRMAALGVILSATTAGVVAGCSSTVAAAGAGAGAAYYLTSRGAEGIAQGSMSDVSTRARTVLQGMNIELSGNEGSTAGEEAEIHGKIAGGDKDVTVELERRSETETLVQVQVKDNALQYDKDMARQIVQQIVEGQAGGQSQGYEAPTDSKSLTDTTTASPVTPQVAPMDTSRAMTEPTTTDTTTDTTTVSTPDTSSSMMQTPQPTTDSTSVTGTTGTTGTGSTTGTGTTTGQPQR